MMRLALLVAAAAGAAATTASVYTPFSSPFKVTEVTPTANGDYFGYAMAQCGAQGQTTIVGTPYYGTGLDSPGAPVAVYNTATRALAYSIPIPTGSSMGFGTDVECNAAATIAIVGAMGYLNSSLPSDGKGSAYIYSLASGSATMIGTSLTPAEAAYGDNFGSSVGLDASGAYALVCSPARPVPGPMVPNGINTGKCYIFSGATYTTVTPINFPPVPLPVPPPAPPMNLSYSQLGGNDGSIAIASGPGFVLAVLGAPAGPSYAAPGSAVMVAYQISALGNMSQPFPLYYVPVLGGGQMGTYSMNGDAFGTMVIISQDTSKIFIGASGGGYVDVYSASLTAPPTYVQTIMAPSTAPPGFGTGLAVSKDNQRLVIGAGAVPSTNATIPGAAYTYVLGANHMYALESTIPSPVSFADGFGYVVGIASDKSTLTVTAPYSSAGLNGVDSSAGGLYVYTLATAASASASNHAAGVAFAAAVSVVAAALAALL